MKRSVNLLTPDLLPPRQRLGLTAVLGVALVCMLALLGLRVHAQIQLQRAQAQLDSLQDRQQQLQQQLNELVALKDQQITDSRLLREVGLLRDELRIKRLLLTELTGREQLKNEGFSRLMQQLASNHERQVWLTRILVREGELELAGKSLDSAAVPRWVQGLKGADSLSGHQFAALQMGRDDDGVLTFSLMSQLPSDAAPAEPPVIRPRAQPVELSPTGGSQGGFALPILVESRKQRELILSEPAEILSFGAGVNP